MHPRTYSIWDVSPQLLRDLRIPQHGCEANFALHAASSVYARSSDIDHGILSQLTQRALHAGPADATLGYGCPLFARKFPIETADLIFKVLQANHCHDLKILKREVCSTAGSMAVITAFQFVFAYASSATCLQHPPSIGLMAEQSMLMLIPCKFIVHEQSKTSSAVILSEFCEVTRTGCAYSSQLSKNHGFADHCWEL